MAVILYFGLPGCGKTTLLTKLAYDASKKDKYDNIYCNVKISVPGVTYISNDCIGKYKLANGLILIDEATLFADNRSYKEFDKQKIEYFLEHRHFNVDIILFTQQWDGIDRKIRVITDRVYYVYKGVLLGHWFTTYYRIPYGIIIPDKKSNGEKLGEIIQGYCKPNLLIRLFAPKVYRPKYYKYFDSWEQPYRPPLPACYKPHVSIYHGTKVNSVADLSLRNKTIILLRWRQSKELVGRQAANCPRSPRSRSKRSNKIMVLCRLGCCPPSSVLAKPLIHYPFRLVDWFVTLSAVRRLPVCVVSGFATVCPQAHKSRSRSRCRG